MEYAVQLLVPILLGTFGGIWIDRHWGTLPWLSIFGPILGMAAGLGMMYKRMVMSQAQKNTPQPKESPHD